MPQTVTLLATETLLQELSSAYEPFFKKTPPYAVFQAKIPGVVITAYQSKKVVFQGEKAETEAAMWEKRGATNSKQTKEKSTSSALPKDFASWNVIGSDEVGNGSYLGPVVVCAAYVDETHMPLLKELGVKDSKMLTDYDIKRIAKEIIHVMPYRKLILTPKKYNEIQPEYNVNRMKVALHNQAIYLLMQDISPITPKGILIDQFTPESNYRKYLSKEKNQVTKPLYFTTKGEQYHLSVAAASIICRAEFLTNLETASKELGFDVPSGAGQKSDIAAAKIIKKGGMPLLEQYAKVHFANTKKAYNLINR